MLKDSRFVFRLSHTERQQIAALADRLQRSESDAVRFVVLNAAKRLADIPQVQEQINLPPGAHVESPTAA